MDKELLKGSIDIVILALTSVKDVYGYEITKKIKDYTNAAYEMGEGTLYPALKRLEEKNLLISYWGDTDKGGRRKYYKITNEGKKALEEKIKNWELINHLINECLQGDEENV
jgi:DNA-binding PadR family transcriptional regulator